MSIVVSNKKDHEYIINTLKPILLYKYSNNYIQICDVYMCGKIYMIEANIFIRGKVKKEYFNIPVPDWRVMSLVEKTLSTIPVSPLLNVDPTCTVDFNNTKLTQDQFGELLS